MPQPGLLQREALPFVLFELLLICGINECKEQELSGVYRIIFIPVFPKSLSL